MHARAPIFLPWEHAAERIGVAARELAKPWVVVGITGPVGAGKSTLAQRLGQCIISTDHYLPNYDEVEEHRRDDPEMSDLPRLAADLAALSRGQATRIPRWSFHSHRREGEQSVSPAPVIVVEGLHALHEHVREALDLRIFVEAPASVRWDRWEFLEATGQRGWGVEVARNYFHSVAEPTFERYRDAYRASADFVVVNGRGVPSSQSSNEQSTKHK